MAENGSTSYGYNGKYVGGHDGGGRGSHMCGVPGCHDAGVLPVRYHSPEDIFNPAGTVAFIEGGGEDMRPPSGAGGGATWWEIPENSGPVWNHFDGMNVGFVDSHVDWFAKDDEDLNADDDRLWSGERP